jgi:hypothetical protein
MKALVSFRECIESDRFAGRAFTVDSWKPMKTILIAAVGQELDPSRAKFFAGCPSCQNCNDLSERLTRWQHGALMRHALCEIEDR